MRLNRICSENAFLDRQYNELKVWLKERGYSDKLVRRQILKGRKFSRSEVLNKQKSIGNKDTFGFNVTYHPMFSKLKNILSQIHLLLALDREHGKVFEKILIIWFRRAKSFKYTLVKVKVAPLQKKKRCCRSCGGTRCEICKHVTTAKTFTSFSTKRQCCIKLDNLNCCPSNVVHLFSCKTCLKQYTCSTESFRSRFNYYMSAHRSFVKDLMSVM